MFSFCAVGLQQTVLSCPVATSSSQSLSLPGEHTTAGKCYVW